MPPYDADGAAGHSGSASGSRILADCAHGGKSVSFKSMCTSSGWLQVCKRLINCCNNATTGTLTPPFAHPLQMRDVYGLLADESAFIREAAATLAARMLRAEAGEREKAETTPKAGKGGKSNAKKGAKTAGVQPKDAHATDVAVLLEVMAWMRTGGCVRMQSILPGGTGHPTQLAGCHTPGGFP
eukprot:scaffold15355_cov21-Tisochrysis_lutea.AAC.4